MKLEETRHVNLKTFNAMKRTLIRVKRELNSGNLVFDTIRLMQDKTSLSEFIELINMVEVAVYMVRTDDGDK